MEDSWIGRMNRRLRRALYQLKAWKECRVGRNRRGRRRRGKGRSLQRRQQRPPRLERWRLQVSLARIQDPMRRLQVRGRKTSERNQRRRRLEGLQAEGLQAEGLRKALEPRRSRKRKRSRLTALQGL